MKILTILGARPQFIKAGTVSREISKCSLMKEVVVHTGQHYDANMSDIFFDEMHISKPDYFLGVGGLSHGAMTGQMIEKIEGVIKIENPDWVMVYGDTNSTLAGAIAASKLHVKVAHVEAGLRSFNMRMPEEINRILTDRVSSLLLCPTQIAVNNLEREGYASFSHAKMVLSGDVMQDGAMFYKKLAKKPGFDTRDEFILCTLHRAENTDDEQRLFEIINSLNEISEDKQIVIPLHPRTKGILEKLNVKFSDKVKVVEPLGYLHMVWLIDNCSIVMTDSGGLQKEAFFFEKPCITLRDETEWSELVNNNFNILVGADRCRIVSGYYEHKFNSSMNINLYGAGVASNSIVDAIKNYA